MGDWVGFGDDAAVAGGLVAWDDAGPVFCADAVADPATGLVGAAGRRERLARRRPLVARRGPGTRRRADGRAADGVAWPRRGAVRSPAGRRSRPAPVDAIRCPLTRASVAAFPGHAGRRWRAHSPALAHRPRVDHDRAGRPRRRGRRRPRRRRDRRRADHRRRPGRRGAPRRTPSSTPAAAPPSPACTTTTSTSWPSPRRRRPSVRAGPPVVRTAGELVGRRCGRPTRALAAGCVAARRRATTSRSRATSTAASLDAARAHGDRAGCSTAPGAAWILNGAPLRRRARRRRRAPAGVDLDAAGAPTGRLLRRATGGCGDRVPRSVPDLGAVGRRSASFGVTAVTDATPVDRHRRRRAARRRRPQRGAPPARGRHRRGAAVHRALGLVDGLERSVRSKVVLADHALPAPRRRWSPRCAAAHDRRAHGRRPLRDPGGAGARPGRLGGGRRRPRRPHRARRRGARRSWPPTSPRSASRS